MPVPNSEQFLGMLKKAKEGHYAYPAINVTSMITANAAMAAFAEAKSDGILQLSLGAGKFASGIGVADSVKGSITVAEHVHRMSEEYGVYIALHTDHCQLKDIDYIKSLVAETRKRREKGLPNLFNGHMFDGSALPLDSNIKIAKEILEECKEVEIIPEFEAGVVGGEEEGAATTDKPENLYTTPEDMLQLAEELYPVDAPFMFAATFGNVHGIYKPGNVELRPSILKDGQAAVREKFGADKEFYLVFHGGSGTPQEQIRETLDYGVVKMNVDTATQYAFSRQISDHFFKNYDGVLMIDGEVGNKKTYDPRSYLKKAEEGMKNRVLQAIEELRSGGKTLYSA